MDISLKDEFEVKNLNKINILLGKNGCGKSTLLKKIAEDFIKNSSETKIFCEYITPERAGHLKYDAGVESGMGRDTWLKDTRNQNQFINFKEQSLIKYLELELNVLREIEAHKREDKTYTFQKYIDKINLLLDNIEIQRTDKKVFKIYTKETKKEITPESISSGESELIALAIECLSFKLKDFSGEKILLLDEPDVHLHPDLQVRLMDFFVELVRDSTNLIIVIATHSTALIGATQIEFANIAFMSPKQKSIEFKVIDEVYKNVLPIFGVHPLSSIFNQSPILLLEGDDDERIWQQAARTSKGLIKLFPCVCGDKQSIRNYETKIIQIIDSIYDNAIAYSLRDMDDGIDNDLDDELPIIRLKLKCYSSENLLICNEVLKILNIEWKDLILKIEDWLNFQKGKKHPHYDNMSKFKEGGYDRGKTKIKNIRNDLMGIIGSNKPWEVVVGQVIGNLKWNDQTNFKEQGSIYNYLGEKVVKAIIPKSQ